MCAMPIRPSGQWLNVKEDARAELLIRRGEELRLLLTPDDVERLLGLLQGWLAASAAERAAWQQEPRCLLQRDAFDDLVGLTPASWTGEDGRTALRLSSGLGIIRMDLSDADVMDLAALCRPVMPPAPVSPLPLAAPVWPGLSCTPVRAEHLAQLDAWVSRGSYRATCTSTSESTLLHLTWGRLTSRLPSRRVTEWAVVDVQCALLGGLRVTQGGGPGWADVAFWYYSPSARALFDDLVQAALSGAWWPSQRRAVACTGQRHALSFLGTLSLSGARETVHPARFPDADLELIYSFTKDVPAPEGTGNAGS